MTNSPGQAEAERLALAACPLCQSEGHTLLRGFCFVGDSTDREDAIQCPTCGCRATLKAWQSRSPVPRSGQTDAVREALQPFAALVPAAFDHSYPDDAEIILSYNGDAHAVLRNIDFRRAQAALHAAPTAQTMQASQFWEALKEQCAATPDKSKVKALVQVRYEDVAAAWNALSPAPTAQTRQPADGVVEALVLESGKHYSDRWGDLHGPMDERTEGVFLDQHGAVYQPDGRQWNHRSESMSTLVVGVSPGASALRTAPTGAVAGEVTQQTKSPAEQMDVREALADRIEARRRVAMNDIEREIIVAALRSPAVSAGGDYRLAAKIIRAANPPGDVREECRKAFEFIRWQLVGNLKEPERSAFWKAVEMRDLLASPKDAAATAVGGAMSAHDGGRAI